MQVPAPMIWMAQKIVDAALSANPAVREQLISLDQKIIGIEETGLGLSIFLLVADRTVQILGYHDGDVDTTIRGSAASLLSLTRDTKGLITGDVEFVGDLEAGKEARRLMALLEIDWEEELSRFAGDTFAHQVGRMHRRAINVITRTGTGFRQDVDEYLTEETELLVSSTAVTGFLSAVDKLRDDVERVEARILLLEKVAGRG